MINLCRLRGLGDDAVSASDPTITEITGGSIVASGDNQLCIDPSCMMTGPYVPLTSPALNMSSSSSSVTSWLTSNSTLLVAVSAGLGILAFVMGRKH